MKKTVSTLSALLSISLVCSFFSIPVNAQPNGVTPVFEKKIADIDYEAPHSDNTLIVMTKPEADESDLKSQIDTKAVTCIMDDEGYELYSVVLEEGIVPEEAMETLADSSDVIYVEPDYYFERETYGSPSGFTASDTVQWQHEAIHTFEAWDLISALPSHGRTRVAVLDTEANIFNYEIYPSVNMTLSCDFTTGKKKPFDYKNPDNHGSHVAGLIGASSVNGSSYFGVASGNTNDCVELVLITTAVDGAILDSSSIIGALNHASKNGCKVANLSFGGNGVDTGIKSLETAIDTCLDRGMICICSSGNDGSARANYPAKFENTIAVGALRVAGCQLTRSDFSSYGAVDISAPGSAIWSIDETLDGYQMMSGTSMSCPIVTGVVSLVLSADPSLTSKQAAEIVIETATDLGDSKTGAGCVNAYAAVRKAISLNNSKYLPKNNTSLYAVPSFTSDHNDKSLDQLYAMALFVTYCNQSIGNNTGSVSPDEFSYAHSHDFDACDYLNRFISSDLFWKKTSKMTNHDFTTVIYKCVLGRAPTTTEYKSAENYLKRKTRLNFIAYFLKRSGTWLECARENPHLDYGNPWNSDYIWNRYN
ncbi:MAG: S8 family serine peptidase [Clostridia bacterium]|nr:S8 family serine peptidase [Clostridia bacterium]